MITYSQTAGNDNAIIWIIELELSTGNAYFCSGFNIDSVTLSTGFESRVYENKLQKGSLTVYEKSLPYDSAGGIGSRGGFAFVIAAFGGYDHNDFYPASGGANILMQPCRIGWIWSGATLTSEITWLVEGEIENFEIRTDGVHIEAVESNALEYLAIPPYKVQKDYDDNFTYYTDAPDEVYGLPIPIVYGNFTSLDPGRGKYRLAPALLVSRERLRFLSTCHKADYTYDDADTKYTVFKYLDGSGSYIEMVPGIGSGGNEFNGHYVNLVPAGARTGAWVLGNVVLWKFAAGAFTDVTDVKVLQEKNYNTDLTLNDGESLGIAFSTDFDKSFGIPNINLSDIELVILWRTTVDGETRSIEIKFYNYVKSGGSGYTGAIGSATQNDANSYIYTYYQIGNVTDGKSDTNLPWQWDELLGLQWVITNNSGSVADTGNIYIKNIYLKINNVVLHKITQFGLKIKIMGVEAEF